MENLPLFRTIVLLLALLLSVQATTTDFLISRDTDLTLPACASRCLASLIPTSGCQATDQECLCAAQDFNNDAAACVQANCTVIEALTTKRIQDTSLCPRPIRNESRLTQRITWVLFGLATAAVIARIFSRLPVSGGSGFGWDDYTILLSLALLIPLDIVLYTMTLSGLGRDIWMLEPSNITRVLYYFWIEEFLYTFILAITKISILLLYLRMWPDPDSQKFRNACLILITTLIVYAITMNIVLAAGCHPISYTWTRWDNEHEGRCINPQGQIFATAVLNILFDLLVFLFPIPKLVKLSFSSPRKKFALCLTFLVGLVVTICSIVRLQYLTVWGKTTNITWGYNPIAIWSNIECNLCVICACVPALAGLFQRLWGVVLGTDMETYGRGSVDGEYELRIRSASFSEWERQKQRRGGRGGAKTVEDDESISDVADAKPLPAQWGATQPLPREMEETALPAQWGATQPLPREMEEEATLPAQWGATKPLPRDFGSER